jgi:hypothetical protein
MALALGHGLAGFMGIAICLLAMLKLMDVAAFATSFRKYDLLVATLAPARAGLYPGVEPPAGLGILLRPELVAANRVIGATALLLLGVMGMASVGKALFIDERGPQLRLRRRQCQGAAGGGELLGKPVDGADGRGAARRRAEPGASPPGGSSLRPPSSPRPLRPPQSCQRLSNSSSSLCRSPQGGDLLGNLTGLAADCVLQRGAAAHARAPRLQELTDVMERDLHRLKGADQGEFREHLLAEQPIAPFGAAQSGGSGPPRCRSGSS